MTITDQPQRVVSLHPADCFGCGDANSRGLGVAVAWQAGQLQFTVPAPRDVQGGFGVAHGGYLSAILDEAMATAAAEVVKAPVVTAALEVRFVRPVLVGDVVRGTITVHPADGVRVRVDAEVLDPTTGRAATRATGRFRIVSGRLWLDAAAATGEHAGALQWTPAQLSRFVDHQLAAILPLVHAPQAVLEPVRITLELTELDDGPRHLVIGPGGLSTDADTAAARHVAVRCDMPTWMSIVRQRRTLRDAAAEGAATVAGDLEHADLALRTLANWEAA